VKKKEKKLHLLQAFLTWLRLAGASGVESGGLTTPVG